ncbi:hypothetical protein D3C76_1587540 [compost metagenome]
MRARGKVAVEIEPAFAHRQHSRFPEQCTQALGGIGIPVAGTMGVDAGGAEQAQACFIQLLAQLQGVFAALHAGAGNHHLTDPGLYRTLYDCR